ncbi:MAG: HAMP domain-containing histidine kinase [Ferruginibacter sp.]|nr:HAMP domain-containing histidine kinase [Ferruginibacter sp.]
MPEFTKANGRSPKYPYQRIFYVGLTDNMAPYHFSQGLIFNVINITGLLIGILRFCYILLFLPEQHTPLLLLINFMPVIFNLLMLFFMYVKAYVQTVYFSFFVFPVSFVVISFFTHDRGALYYLFPYVIYSFFFLNSRKKIFTAFVSISMMFITAIIIENKVHGLTHRHDFILEMISIVGVFVLSSVTLFSIKFQIWKYQDKIKAQREALQKTNRRIAQQAERLSETILIKDKVFSIISHDIRSPLQGLYLIVEADINDNISLETIKEILPQLKEELKKAFDLFENLLNWAKMQIKETHITIDTVDVNALVGRIQNHLAKAAEEKHVNVKADFTDYYIPADKDILEIVLRNVISNAIKFSHPGESVQVSGKASEGDYEITVSDSGIGISAEKLAKINDKAFYSTPGTNNEQGTGLGLIICRDLVEKCNGSFTIKSEKDTGTSVHIKLPHPKAFS